MAATPGGESMFDSGRLSLFDLIQEKNRAQNKVTIMNALYLEICYYIGVETLYK